MTQEFANKLNKRLNHISDHSKIVENKRSALSAIIIEIVVYAYFYKAHSFYPPIGYALIALSAYHMVKMLLTIKREKKNDKVTLTQNYVYAVIHGLMIVFFLINIFL